MRPVFTSSSSSCYLPASNKWRDGRICYSKADRLFVHLHVWLLSLLNYVIVTFQTMRMAVSTRRRQFLIIHNSLLRFSVKLFRPLLFFTGKNSGKETWTWALLRAAMTNCLMTKFWSVFLLEFAWFSSDNENQREPKTTSERQTAAVE